MPGFEQSQINRSGLRGSLVGFFVRDGYVCRQFVELADEIVAVKIEILFHTTAFLVRPLFPPQRRASGPADSVCAHQKNSRTEKNRRELRGFFRIIESND